MKNLKNWYKSVCILLLIVVLGCAKQVLDQNQGQSVISVAEKDTQSINTSNFGNNSNEMAQESVQEEIGSVTFYYPKLNRTERYFLTYLPKESRQKVAELMIAGDIAYLHNNFDGAIKIFDDVLSLDQKNEIGYFYRSMSYLALGKADKALSDINKAIEINPKNNEYYFHRADVYWKLGEPNKAITEMNDYIETNPTSYLAHLYRADYYFWQENYAPAERDYSKVIGLNPNNAKAYAYRGFIWKQIYLDAKRALPDLEKSLSIEPSILGYLHAGKSKAALDDFEGAVKHLSKGIELYPKEADLYLVRGAIYYYELGEIDKARDDYNKAIELNPTQPKAYEMRADLKVEIGDSEGADQDYDMLIKLSPNYWLNYQFIEFWK